jgi:hypothetical protein
MTAEIIPYPAARRRDLVASIARRALQLEPLAGHRHILRSLDVQAAAMRRKGISDDLIERETESLRWAVVLVMEASLPLPRETC